MPAGLLRRVEAEYVCIVGAWFWRSNYTLVGQIPESCGDTHSLSAARWPRVVAYCTRSPELGQASSPEPRSPCPSDAARVLRPRPRLLGALRCDTPVRVHTALITINTYLLSHARALRLMCETTGVTTTCPHSTHTPRISLIACNRLKPRNQNATASRRERTSRGYTHDQDTVGKSTPHTAVGTRRRGPCGGSVQSHAFVRDMCTSSINDVSTCQRRERTSL